MLLFPAIDLKEGKCVRLYKGDMDKATVYNNSPAEQAKAFMNEGARWIHVVDLDGAFAGKPANVEAVNQIVEACSSFDCLEEHRPQIQLGGGIRDIAIIEMWLNYGVDRVILGTAAVKNPSLVLEACKRAEELSKNTYNKKQIAVGIDARDGFVATEGWAEKSSVSVIELAKKFEDAGVAAIIYTDISKDGAMQGADFEGTKALAEAVKIPVILSGGISSVADLERAKKLPLEGVISGRAIYEKAFTVKQAIEILK